MFQTADESHARVWYVMQCGLFSWVVISGLLEIPHAWSCVVTISSISGIDIMEASINLASTSHAGLRLGLTLTNPNPNPNSSYSSEFKLKAVRFAEDCNSNRKAAAKFGVDRKRIREWRQKKSKLEAARESGSREPDESHSMKT